MPFSNYEPVPASVKLVPLVEADGSAGVPFDQKFVPLNQDGTIFDCTAMTYTMVSIDNGQPKPFAANQVITINPNQHDSTGFTLTFAANVIANACTLGNVGSRYTITAFDGANLCVVATGIWQAQPIAQTLAIL
jgi:hypothetical protein